MATFDWNQDPDVSLKFKSLFGIYDNGDHATGNLYNFDTPLEVEVTTIANVEVYYSARGKKRVKLVGDSSEYRLLVKKTQDLFDTASPPTDKRTISYFQDLIMNKRIIPEAAWEGVSETEASSNEFVRHQFTGTVESIVDRRNEDTGALEVEISGQILDHIKHRAEAA